MTQTYDAIVIGAGVMGASIAFHLAERGLKVAILERKVTASGATGHSSGLVRMHYDLAAESELTFASYKNYFSNWKERVGGDCGFMQTGFMQIAKREHEDKLRGNVANQQRIGINTSVISADDVKKLVPDFIPRAWLPRARTISAKCVVLVSVLNIPSYLVHSAVGAIRSGRDVQRTWRTPLAHPAQ